MPLTPAESTSDFRPPGFAKATPGFAGFRDFKLPFDWLRAMSEVESQI
jgi:hypothetical protein